MDTEGDRIIINVGGKRHETYASTLQNIPDTRLAWIAESFLNGNTQEYFFDRHPKIFGIILNFYRTGQLHAPRDFCGPLFEDELEFWGINEQQMEACCWPFYTQHRDAEKNLKDFVGPEFEDSDDDDDSSHDLDASFGPGTSLSFWALYRPRAWALLDDAHSSITAKVFAVISLLMILASVATMCASSVVSDNEYITALEYAFCAWFTLEFGARLLFCPNKIAFLKEIMTWVDFISLLPFYGKIILEQDTLNFIRPLRLIRIFRALKFFAFTSGLQIIVQSLKASFRELILLLIILLIPVVVFSSVLFEIEKNNSDQPHFQNIPEAFWWAIITMTTVGYGDMVPKTIPGRLVGSLCAICGVLIVALPVSIIGNNFSTFYAHAQARLSLPKKKRRLIVGEAKLRIGIPQGQSNSSASLGRLNDREMPQCYTENTTEESYSKQYRRYHRRSRNTLFANGDVYIGPGSLLERGKVNRGDSCAEVENESESEAKSECLTVKETVSIQDPDTKSEKMADLSAPSTQGTPIPSFKLINSTHESEEIIEERTGTDSALSNHGGMNGGQLSKSFNIPASRRKKSTRSKSWVELKSIQSPVENRRSRGARGVNKRRVSPATDQLQQDSNQYLSTKARSLSPSLKTTGSLLKLDVETSRLDSPNFERFPEQETKVRTPNSKVLNDAFQRTRKASEHEHQNGHTV